MKYNKDFLPRVGDRVIIINKTSCDLYRIAAVSDTSISLIKVGNGMTTYKSVMLNEIRYIKKCPWYLPWQK